MGIQKKIVSIYHYRHDDTCFGEPRKYKGGHMLQFSSKCTLFIVLLQTSNHIVPGCPSPAEQVAWNWTGTLSYSTALSKYHRPTRFEQPRMEKRAWKHSLMPLGLSHVPRLWVTVNYYWLWSRRAGVTALLNTNPVLGLLLVSLSRSLSVYLLLGGLAFTSQCSLPYCYLRRLRPPCGWTLIYEEMLISLN